MKGKNIEITARGREQEKRPLMGLRARIYVGIKNWPSLGITPDKPEYALSSVGGPLAISRSRDALKTWARKNYVQITTKSTFIF